MRECRSINAVVMLPVEGEPQLPQGTGLYTKGQKHTISALLQLRYACT